MLALYFEGRALLLLCVSRVAARSLTFKAHMIEEGLIPDYIGEQIHEKLDDNNPDYRCLYMKIYATKRDAMRWYEEMRVLRVWEMVVRWGMDGNQKKNRRKKEDCSRSE